MYRRIEHIDGNGAKLEIIKYIFNVNSIFIDPMLSIPLQPQPFLLCSLWSRKKRRDIFSN